MFFVGRWRTREIFRLVRTLRNRGVTLIYVSHRLEELFELCDQITVLRDGKHVATEPMAQTHRGRVVSQMIGRELQAWTPRHLERELGPERLKVEAFASRDRFSGIDFTVRAGVVVGIAGLVGAGRTAVAQAIFGLDPAATGRVEVKGRILPPHSVRAALEHGLGLVPEDRKKEGLILSLNCRENTTLAALPRVTRLGWVNRRREQTLAENFSRRFRLCLPRSRRRPPPS